MVECGENPLSGSQTAPSCCVLTWWKGLGVLWSLFSRTLMPLMKAPPSWPEHLPRPHLLRPSHWGLGVQHMTGSQEKANTIGQCWPRPRLIADECHEMSCISLVFSRDIFTELASPSPCAFMMFCYSTQLPNAFLTLSVSLLIFGIVFQFMIFISNWISYVLRCYKFCEWLTKGENTQHKLKNHSNGHNA